MSLKNSKKKSGCFGKMPPGEILERLYCLYNKREYVDPDPLLFLYRYHERRDQELAAFVASSLAYGRVGGILRSVRKVLDPLGEHPAVLTAQDGTLALIAQDVKHLEGDGGGVHGVRQQRGV